MQALIHNAKVAQVASESFPVHQSMQWVNSPAEVQPGWSYSDGQFIHPIEETTPDPRTIMTCGALQFRKALRQLGKMDAVKSYVEQADEETQEAWEYATEFKRLDPFIVGGMAALGVSDAEVDAVFELAVTM